MGLGELLDLLERPEVGVGERGGHGPHQQVGERAEGEDADGPEHEDGGVGAAKAEALLEGGLGEGRGEEGASDESDAEQEDAAGHIGQRHQDLHQPRFDGLRLGEPLVENRGQGRQGEQQVGPDADDDAPDDADDGRDHGHPRTLGAGRRLDGPRLERGRPRLDGRGVRIVGGGCDHERHR